MMTYYKGLIALRKSSPLFTESGVIRTFDIDTKTGFMAVKFEKDTNSALLILNPTTAAVSYTVDGIWNSYVDGVNAGVNVLSTVNGSVSVPAYSAIVLMK